jgi:hypothetical protein
MNAGETAPEWADVIKSVMQDEGDMMYSDGTGTPIALPKGTGDQILTMNTGATAPEWKSYADIPPIKIWAGTLAEYNALGVYDNSTLYFCT